LKQKELVQKLLQEIESLRSEIAELKEKKAQLSQPRESKPECYTLSLMGKVQEREALHRERIKPLLKHAVEMVLLHFKKQPPKRKVT